MKTSAFSTMCFAAFFAYVPMTASAVSLSKGCDDPQNLDSGTHTTTIAQPGRTFRIHVPKNYNHNTPTPLITIFHGWGGNENEFIGDRTVRSEADKRGYILVAPRGLGSESPDNNYNSWSFSGSTTGLDGDGGKICDDSITPDYSYESCKTPPTAINTCSWTHCPANDVEFVVALVEEIKAELCIDADNIFATGGSNGGMFTWELGQNATSYSTFKAIAPLIGLPHRGYLQPQDETVIVMPALVITGTRDKVVPPGEWDSEINAFTTTSNGNDRYYYTGATPITLTWALEAGCSMPEAATVFDVGYRKADCRTYCLEDAKEGGWPRVLDCRARMGHTYNLRWTWKLIMDFFDAHSAP